MNLFILPIICKEIYLKRDKNDYPILYTAIIENIDIFITGGKDFLDVDVEMPEIMTPADFVERYMKA